MEGVRTGGHGFQPFGHIGFIDALQVHGLGRLLDAREVIRLLIAGEQGDVLGVELGQGRLLVLPMPVIGHQAWNAR